MRTSRAMAYGFAAAVWTAASVPRLAAVDPPPFVYVSRVLAPAPAGERTAAVERGSEGKLLVFEGGRERTLYAPDQGGHDRSLPADVLQPDVSFDAARVVFAGYVPAESGWRIFEIQADGSGLRRVTGGDRRLDLARYGEAAESLQHHDDVDPCYLPDGRICFVSTRYPGLAPEGRLRTTNLYVVNADGTDLHRITTERFGADTPAVHPRTGQIVFSRWWRTVQTAMGTSHATHRDPGAPEPPVEEPPPAPPPIPPGSPAYGGVGQGERPPSPPPPPGKPPLPPSQELVFTSATVLRAVAPEAFPGVNSWFLSAIDPDGGGLAMFSGFRLDREKTQAYQPSFRPNGEAVALFIHQTPILGLPGENGLRVYRAGAASPQILAGPQTFAGLTGPRGSHVFASAAALADGRILVSAAPEVGGARDFDIWLQDNAGLVLVHGSRGTAEMDPVPLVARSLPPVIPDATDVRMTEDAPRTVEEAYELGSFTFSCANIHANAPINMPVAGAPPVGKGLSIEFYMAQQRTASFPQDPPILVARRDIGPDGKVEIELPAGVPLFEVLRRPDGALPLGRDGQIYHVGGLNFGQPGRVARCVGCHAGHSMQTVPPDPTFTNLAPSAVVSTSAPAPLDVGPFFAPEALVDRSTTPIAGEWAAGATAPETFVRLRWNAPLRAREAVIYGPQPIPGATTRQVIRGLRVQTFRLFLLQDTVHVRGEVLAAGTSVPLDPSREFDLLVVTILRPQVNGAHFGNAGPALAEIEVLAQATGSAPVTSSFLRGDANCDLALNVADAVAMLGSLFAGDGPLCCGDAADVNRDGAMNVADVVHLLNFAFRGGNPPAAPFPECGRATSGTIGCDVESCD